MTTKFFCLRLGSHTIASPVLIGQAFMNVNEDDAISNMTFSLSIGSHIGVQMDIVLSDLIRIWFQSFFEYGKYSAIGFNMDMDTVSLPKLLLNPYSYPSLNLKPYKDFDRIYISNRSLYELNL